MFPTKTSADKKQDGGERTESTTYLEPGGRAGSLGGPGGQCWVLIKAWLSSPGPGQAPGIVGRSLWSKVVRKHYTTDNTQGTGLTLLYFVRHDS